MKVCAFQWHSFPFSAVRHLIDLSACLDLDTVNTLMWSSRMDDIFMEVFKTILFPNLSMLNKRYVDNRIWNEIRVFIGNTLQAEKDYYAISQLTSNFVLIDLSWNNNIKICYSRDFQDGRRTSTNTIRMTLGTDLGSRKALLRPRISSSWLTCKFTSTIKYYTNCITMLFNGFLFICRSGSIHGPTFEILKITVKRLLGTLTQYDFFNILQVWFNLTNVIFKYY